MKYLILIFTTALYVTACTSILFLILPSYGEYWGLTFSLVTILLSFLLGDKFILGIIKAKQLSKNSQMYSIFQNFSYQQELNDGSLYISSRFKNNIFAIKSPFSSTYSVIIGDELESALGERELKSLAFGIIEEVKEGHAKVNLLYTEILFLCYLPLIFIQKLFKSRTNIILSSLSYLFFPLKGLENYFFNQSFTFKRIKLFNNLTQLTFLDFETALIKLKEKPAFLGQMTLIDKLIYNLTIANNKFDSFLDVIFNGSGSKYR